ncbi:hypothetical protein [Lutibacter sp.]|uniref:hypothetical protein n=1 Tax=Lutibacter sp. TaxID=1925666 RepID=UPI0034A04BDB
MAEINARIDSKRIKKENYINNKGHFVRAAIRFVVIATSSLFMLRIGIVDYIAINLICYAIFWILFDLLINDKLGKPLFRIGETSKTDRFLQKISCGEEDLAFLYKLNVLLMFAFTYMHYLIYF